MKEKFSFTGKKCKQSVAGALSAWKSGRTAVLGTVALLVCLAAVISCGRAANEAKETEAAPEYVFTYSENQSEDYPTTQGAYRFAELVKERTGGRIEILVRAEGVMGDEQKVVEQLQYGGIDFVRASLGSVAEFVPELNVLQMPYLYTDSDHMWRVLGSDIGREFMGKMEKYGLVGLSWYDAGARNFYTSERPIEKLEDMQGMKIRVQESAMMAEMVEALGGTALPLSYDKVYSALETGEIDGAENNWPSYESMNHFEVAPYYTVDEHSRLPEVQIISQLTWQKLTPEDQQILLQCAEESAQYERQLWSLRSESSERRVREAGCTIIELTPEEKARFREAVMPLYEKYCSEYMDIVNRIMEEGK